MKHITNFIGIFLFLIINTVYAQNFNEKVNNVVWGVKSTFVTNGKIIVLDIDEHYFVPFSFRVEKWAGKTGVEMEGYFVLDVGGGTENVLSSTFTFNDLDFGESILTTEKTGNLGFDRNLSRIGTVKFKFREKLNGTWQPYRYASKTQETVFAPRPDITIDGPDHICSTGSYSIGNAQYIPGVITLENATGIASLTYSNDGTFSIERIGNAVGSIAIKVSYDNRYFTKVVKVGTFTTSSIGGNYTIQLGEYRDYTIPLSAGITDFNWSMTYSSNVILTKLSNNKVRLSTTGSAPFGYKLDLILKAVPIGDCGTSSQVIEKAIKFVNERAPLED